MSKNQGRILLEERIGHNIDSSLLDRFEHLHDQTRSWSYSSTSRACVITVEMIEERLLEEFKTLRLQSTTFLG